MPWVICGGMEIIMRYPDFIKENDEIGFVSPSFGCAIEPYKSAFDAALKNFERLGYRTNVGPNCYKTDGIGISTSPDKCGTEFTEYYLSEKNSCLISCGGGELMCESIDYVDFDKIREGRPKWFIGYSDNTNMTFLLATLCDVASLYGPCASTFGMSPWHKSLYDAMDILSGKKKRVTNYHKWEKDSLKSPENPFAPYNVTEETELKVFPGETAKMTGRLLGGCLDCLSNLVGTKYDRVKEFAEKYGDDGIIWFLEACDLNVMSIRRAMWQLDRAGWFKNVKGFIIGRPYNFGQEIMGLDQYSAVMGVVSKYNVPVIMDADVGHLAPMMPLVTGSVADVVCEDNRLCIDMRYE